MNAAPLPVVFVHLGRRLPHGIGSAIRQARLASPARRIIVASDNPRVLKRHDVELIDVRRIEASETTRSFWKTHQLDDSFRSGFWANAAARLFVVGDVLRHLDLAQAIHLENDVLIQSPPGIDDRLRSAGRGVFLPFSSRVRGIASFVYIHGTDALDETLRVMIEQMRTKRLPSEMEFLAAAMVAEAPIYPLPSMPSSAFRLHDVDARHETGHMIPEDSFSSGYPKLRLLFDATAIGHYLAGADPANDRYLSRNLFVSAEANFDILKFQWAISSDPEGIPRIHLTCDGKRYDLANLHMHCKSFPPLDTEHLDWYRTRIDAANQRIEILHFEGGRLLRDSVRSPRDAASFGAQCLRALAKWA